MSPVAFWPMPPGERMPEQAGIISPSGVMRMVQPRQVEFAVKDPVRQRVIQTSPLGSGLLPKAYSW